MAGIFENLTVDTEFFAVYTKIITYTVTWIGCSGETLKTESVRKGENATPPSDPTGDWFVFLGWNHDGTNITSDLEIKAEYREVIKYTVTWIGHNGVTLKTESVESGTNATPPTAPNVEGYTFNGWSSDGTNITSDLEIRAEYTEISLKLFAIIQGGSELEIEEGSQLLTLFGHNFGKSILSTNSGTGFGNSSKLIVKYGDTNVSFSACSVTLGDTSNLSLNASTGVLTRLLGDKFNSPECSSTITIEYNGKSIVRDVICPRFKMKWMLNWKTKGLTGDTWWRVYPCYESETYVKTERYTNKEDLAQFEPSLYYTPSIGTKTYLEYKIVAGSYVDGSPAYHYEVNIPSTIDDIQGEVNLKQTSAKGFKNVATKTFEFALNGSRGYNTELA